MGFKFYSRFSDESESSDFLLFRLCSTHKYLVICSSIRSKKLLALPLIILHSCNPGHGIAAPRS
jgi:hypothetical protein